MDRVQGRKRYRCHILFVSVPYLRIKMISHVIFQNPFYFTSRFKLYRPKHTITLYAFSQVPSEPKVRLKPRWLNVKAPAPLQASEVQWTGLEGQAGSAHGKPWLASHTYNIQWALSAFNCLLVYHSLIYSGIYIFVVCLFACLFVPFSLCQHVASETWPSKVSKRPSRAVRNLYSLMAV